MRAFREAMDNQAESDHPPLDDAWLREVIVRMRAGERLAAAAFMDEVGPLIRRHYRRKLGRVMRRVVNSQDLLSTIARRLDRRVLSGGLRMTEPGQLWALVFRIGDSALVDRVHLVERLTRVEREDSEIGLILRKRILDGACEDDARFSHEIDDLLETAQTSDDKTMLVLWLHGSSLLQIAEQLGISHAAARKRWERLKTDLRLRLEGR